jgi:Tol biopolymer transport system component
VGISAHGRFVAFTSGANEVFVRDRLTGVTTMESVSSRGAPGNEGSFGGALSADGRVLTFPSYASNLVPGDTNQSADVFARDRVRGVTERVSVATSGRQANGAVVGDWPAISANGRYVAFDSDASNLVPGDTDGSNDVFVRDRSRRVTERVSVATSGRQGNGDSYSPSISSDGRYVAFASDASNLVRGDSNGWRDVFVRDRLKKVTYRVSLNSAGHQFTSRWSDDASISGNGRYVAFSSYQLTNGNFGPSVIMVRDRLGGVTRQVAGSSSADPGLGVSMSQDGRYVGYSDQRSHMYLWDQRCNVTYRLPSVGNSASDLYVNGHNRLSADAHHAVFSGPPPVGQASSVTSAYVWDDVSDMLAARTFR